MMNALFAAQRSAGNAVFRAQYVGAPIVLVGANSTESSSSSTGAATVTPAQANVVNLTAAGSSQTSTSSTGAATVTPAAHVVNLTAAASAQTSQSSTGAASVTASSSQTGSTPGTITVPASRTAVFAAHPRVAVFTDTGPVSLTKAIADQLYIVGDFTKPLADGATTAASVAIVNPSVTVLEGPVAQGALMVAKIGAFDPSGGQFTYRVTCANGEVIDGTILLTALDDRSQQFGKDPDDHRFYAFDVSADLALSGSTTISSIATPVTSGVSALSVPAIQGSKPVVLLGGLELSGGGNACELVMTLGTTEVIHRTAYFSRQDH